MLLKYPWVLGRKSTSGIEALIMPALVRPEGSQVGSTWRFGLVLLEAQQLGRLVICYGHRQR